LVPAGILADDIDDHGGDASAHRDAFAPEQHKLPLESNAGGVLSHFIPAAASPPYLL
jgi:hypothetical protein